MRGDTKCVFIRTLITFSTLLFGCDEGISTEGEYGDREQLQFKDVGAWVDAGSSSRDMEPRLDVSAVYEDVASPAYDVETNPDDVTVERDTFTPETSVTDLSIIDQEPLSPEDEPAPWEPSGTLDLESFAWGIQIGDAIVDSAILSIRTQEPAVNTIIARGYEHGWEPIETVEGLLPVDGIVHHTFEGLSANTPYSVVVYSTDGTRRSFVARFRTALASGTSRKIRFGATSGLGGNEPWPNLSEAAQENLDFFLLLGDTIYADWGEDTGFVAKWQEALSTQGLLNLAQSTSFIATWDDHEVANNWSYSTPGMEEVVQEALEAYFEAMPQRIGPGGTGIWRHIPWGAAMDIFVLDCRGERRDGNYISVEQMEWLKEMLALSPAYFKIIVNSVPITDLFQLVGPLYQEDRWQGYPTQRLEILNHIDSNGITGVLWVSGDFHLGSISLIGAPGDAGAQQWEVLSGPSGSPINVGAYLFSPSERFPIIIKQHNYTLFEADPERGEVLVRYVADDGSTIDEMILEL